MKTVGVAMVLIGTTMADSDSLVAPIIAIAVGALLMMIGRMTD